jgi:heme/copper-type cytochrome/quinol oxidase subunit 2
MSDNSENNLESIFTVKNMDNLTQTASDVLNQYGPDAAELILEVAWATAFIQIITHLICFVILIPCTLYAVKYAKSLIGEEDYVPVGKELQAVLISLVIVMLSILSIISLAGLLDIISWIGIFDPQLYLALKMFGSITN